MDFNMSNETGCTGEDEISSELLRLRQMARAASQWHPKATGKIVKHERGRVGMVVFEDPIGHFHEKGRPTYKVLDLENLHTYWWYQDRCKVLVDAPVQQHPEAVKRQKTA